MTPMFKPFNRPSTGSTRSNYEKFTEEPDRRRILLN